MNCGLTQSEVIKLIELKLASDGIVDKDDVEACIAEALQGLTGNDTTYSLSDPVPDGNGNCVITLTGSDGSTQEIIIAKPIPESDGVHQSGDPTFNPTTNVITFPYVNDADESPAAPVNVDLSALVSDPFTITGGDNITVTFNANTGEYTISASGSATDTFGTLIDNNDGTYTWTPAGGGTPIVIAASAVLNGCDGGPIPADHRHITYEQLISLGTGLNIDWDVDGQDPCSPPEVNACLDNVRLYSHKPKDEDTGLGGDIYVRPSGTSGPNAWNLANVSAGHRTQLITAEQQTYDVSGQELAAIPSGGQLEVARIVYELTNTDCVPWSIRGHSRVAVQRTAWRPNSNWSFTVSGGPDQSGLLGAGIGITYWDDSANTDAAIFSHHDIDTEWYRQTPLLPNQSVVFDLVFNLNKINGVAYPDTAAAGPLRLNSPLLLVEVSRTCAEFNPFLSGVQTV